MRTALLFFLVIIMQGGEALTPEQQRQHEAWLEAMRQSQAVGKPDNGPAASPIDPKGTPEYQNGEQANKEAEAQRIREEQARWKAEREAREQIEADASKKREAEEAARWAELRRQQEQRAQEQRDAQAAEERRREAAAEAERERTARLAMWSVIGGVVIGIVCLVVILLPIIVAGNRGVPQRGAVAALVILSVLAGLGVHSAPALAGAAALMWAAAWVLALWRYA
jgi:thiol:disulfide interchange protein